MPVTDSERATLQARGIDNEAAQKYLVWRRSIFFMVAGATSVSALLHVIVALAHGEFKDLSALGVFSELVRIFSQLAMPVAGVFAYLFWARVRLSRLFRLR